MTQTSLFNGFDPPAPTVKPFRKQLLKWIGNKQRFADEIVSFFPRDFGNYYEPFLGSGAVMATLAPQSPHRGVGSDTFAPLIEIWQVLADDPDTLKSWYTERWHALHQGDKVEQYEKLKASYNQQPNGPDFLMLCRACYGGVIRFRKSDGYCSTPCGPHNPIPPDSFAARVDEWHRRLQHCTFEQADFEQVMDRAQEGDIIYCDPPYSHSQAILYGAQSFSLPRLLRAIERAKSRGVFVALSIDGSKKTTDRFRDLPIPNGLFAMQTFVNCGRSMLHRFQRGGETLEDSIVHDRLLLTHTP